MVIIMILISIFILAAFAWLIRNFTTIKICPVCTGVAGTWIWLIAGIFAGILPQAVYQLPAAILMGGSVVGIAYQLEKKLPLQKSSILFKLIFIPTGFFTMYSLILSQWLEFVFAILFLAILLLFFIKAPKNPAKINKNIEEIKNKIKNCC